MPRRSVNSPSTQPKAKSEKPKAESREPKAESRKPKAGSRKPKADKPLRILMIASEAQPFSKTGGLADVATALPRALGRLGHDVTLITPKYRGIADGPVVADLTLEVAAHRFKVQLMEASASGREGGAPRVLVIDCPELYDRAGIYSDTHGDYADNAVRYAMLSAAAINWASSSAQGQPPAPFDIIHAHDWQGGLAPIYARRLGTAGTPGPRTVFTIHNLAYQGVFDKTWVPRLGLNWADFTMGGFEFFDHLSFMKAGINFADAITTVSPTYAEEIQRPEYGHGLDGVIRTRRAVLAGILNGIDPDEWNPAADPHLPAPFDADHLEGKAAAKRALLELFGFPLTDAMLARPIIGMVSRMVDQKGLDLISAVAGELASLDATFVIVGTGEPRYQEMWRNLARWRPEQFGVFVGFDERRAHLVEGGADIFLMPSQFEPCGLNQMYSLRYGTVPVVRAVGGLVDTVKPHNPRNGQGTGFMFAAYHPAAMMGALGAALAAYPHKKVWTRLQKNGMKADFSWDRSAGEYVKMYRKLSRGNAERPVASNKQ
jgi:starch synthase